MAQVNFRIDDETKRQAEELFGQMGLTMSSAIMVFIRQSINERAIPFKVQVRDPSARPMSELLQRIDDVEHGRNCHYHDLLEDDQVEARPRSKPSRASRRRRGAVA